MKMISMTMMMRMIGVHLAQPLPLQQRRLGRSHRNLRLHPRRPLVAPPQAQLRVGPIAVPPHKAEALRLVRRHRLPQHRHAQVAHREPREGQVLECGRVDHPNRLQPNRKVRFERHGVLHQGQTNQISRFARHVRRARVHNPKSLNQLGNHAVLYLSPKNLENDVLAPHLTTCLVKMKNQILIQQSPPPRSGSLWGILSRASSLVCNPKVGMSSSRNLSSVMRNRES